MLTLIRSAVSSGGIPKHELAEEAKLHRNSLTNIESESWDPRVSTVRELLAAITRIHERRTAAITPAPAAPAN